MSNLETLLTAWLNDGEVPAGFQPETRIEEYLVAILEGVDDSVTPKSRADMLLDAIATKYAGYADGIDDLMDTLFGETPPGEEITPAMIATAMGEINSLALAFLAEHGATADPNTLAIIGAQEELIAQGGGAELNIAYGDTAPEDTTKLWVKTAQPQNITVDYNPDNTVETVTALTAVLPNASREIACGVVGTKLYMFGGYASVSPTFLNKINVYDTETGTMTPLTNTTLPTGASAIGCGVVGTKIYLFGGAKAGNPGNLTTINVFDTETETITTLPSPATLPVMAGNIAVGVVGTKCYLFGGWNGTRLDTINVFDTETNTISTLPARLPFGVITTCGVVGTKCYLFGGSNSSGALDKIIEFDTETNTVTPLDTTLPSAVEYPNVAARGTKIYLLGGYDHDTINVFDATTKTVTTLTDTTLPVNTGNGACGAVGDDIYIFGGWNGSDNTKTGYKFNITFPLAEGAVFVHEDMLRNKFTLVKEPTKVTVGVTAVSKGNANGYAENAEAYLHDGTQWRQI